MPAIWVLLIALLPCSGALADPAVWAVAGESNTVYLFGSVHLLPEGGFGLAGELKRAYRDAARVCLEVDIAALTPTHVASVTLTRAIDPDGRGLFELLGQSAGPVREAAAAAGIDLTPFAGYEPWFAAMTVTVIALQQHGFSADHGVEQVIQRLAQQDGKQSCGLESFDEQLAFLDSLPARQQQDLMLQSLEEAAHIDEEMTRLFEAWQRGDEPMMARELETGFADFPGLADQLVFERNERWAEQITALLDEPDDVLVVVGALHLVGDRGLPAELERRGFRVERR